MSMKSVRSYMRAMCKNVGLSEWKDSFNSDNIPENILDKAFFLDMRDVTQGQQRSQWDQVVLMPLTVRIFKKGYRTPADAIDAVIELTENLIKEACAPVNSNAQTNGIKGVLFDSCRYDPIDQSNDNAVVSEVTFNFTVSFDLNNS